MAKNSKSGILSFRGKNQSELPSSISFYQNIESKYNKADLLNFFGVLNDYNIINTGQFEAGIIFIRKDADTIKFIENWISVFLNDFHFIDDSPSMIPNIEGFIDHRHDQSIYSILCKLKGVEELCTSEYYTDADWSLLSENPIWVKRDMDFGLFDKIKKKIKRAVKFLIRKIYG